VILAAVVLMLLGSNLVRGVVVIAAGALLLRKFIQTLNAGHSAGVSAIYAIQTYYSKIPIAIGEMKWLLAQTSKPSGSSS
jgi:hypothetical protein